MRALRALIKPKSNRNQPKSKPNQIKSNQNQTQIESKSIEIKPNRIEIKINHLKLQLKIKSNQNPTEIQAQNPTEILGIPKKSLEMLGLGITKGASPSPGPSSSSSWPGWPAGAVESQLELGEPRQLGWLACELPG